MARPLLFILPSWAILALILLPPSASGQNAQRNTKEHLEETLERLEDHSDQFRESVEDALDNSRIQGTEAENQINNFIQEFEEATDRLKDKFDDDDAAEVEAEVVMREAVRIETFLRRHSMGTEVQSRWAEVRRDLRSLASAYGVRWTLGGQLTMPNRFSEEEMQELLERIESKAEQFRSDLEDGLDQSRIDDTDTEEQIRNFVEEFVDSANRLKERFDDDESATPEVKELLERAAYIDRFMNQHNRDSELQAQWLDLRRDLDTLATEYGVNSTW